jgi:CheY-like chemotaxis protein
MSLTEKAKILTTKNDVKIRILHVDDNPDTLETSKEILMDINGNFEIDGACSVSEGLRKLAAENYDVVISDYKMPQKDGLEFLKELRDQNNEIPFIMFTGKGREEVAIKALNLGATRYFTKQGDTATVYGELSYGIIQSVEQARLSQNLKQKYAIIESVTEDIGAGLAVIGRDYRIIWANKTQREHGVEEGKLCYSACNKLNVVCPDCGLNRLFEGTLAFDSHDYTNKDSEGVVFWNQIIVTPIRDEHGNVIAALELSISITERKEAEEKLRVANLFIQSLKQPEELKSIH